MENFLFLHEIFGQEALVTFSRPINKLLHRGFLSRGPVLTRRGDEAMGASRLAERLTAFHYTRIIVLGTGESAELTATGSELFTELRGERHVRKMRFGLLK